MATFGRVIFGFLMGLLSLLGLFMAANAQDTGFYQAGLMITLFGCFMIFYLISRVNFDDSH
ncbi:hypothetical protein ACTL6U_10435 [Rhodovibrionaceae bacterium A322]